MGESAMTNATDRVSIRRKWPAGAHPTSVGTASVAAAIAFILFPYDLAFLTRIVIMMIFVLSFDLILGYAGIATPGHAAMYGCGAYAAGLVSLHLASDPLIGLLAGAIAGAMIA
ncbi:hypothetical protein ACOJBO_00190 [Rhizobium beringeri]